MAATKSRIRIIVNEEFCKGCRLCILACPRHAMELGPHMGARGSHPAYLARPDDCSGCTQCALMCPDACITISRDGAEAKSAED